MELINPEKLKTLGQVIGDRIIIDKKTDFGIVQVTYNLTTSIRGINSIFRLK